MNSTTQKVNEIFHWKEFWNCDCHCRIRIYFPIPPEGHSTVAVVIATDSNEGTSITNDAEKIIKLVCDRFSLDANFTIWIEHYLEADDYPETFDKVSIFNGQVQWERICPNDVERLIECELDA